MYKDKDKQREANRLIQAKRRSKGVTQGVTELGCDKQGVTEQVKSFDTAEELIKELHEPERTAQGNIRVSKPGDADYEPQCETTRAFIEDRAKRPETHKRGKDIKCFGDLPERTGNIEGIPKPERTAKRGKDIKCFGDLPVDVQETINKMSFIDGKFDQDVKAKRTAVAIHYQHLFPDRYHSMRSQVEAKKA